MTGPTAPPAADPPPAPQRPLLDEALPRYEAREVHAVRIGAPQAEVFRALEWALRAGFIVLASRPGSELVVGAVGQPWMPSGGASATITDQAGFVAFDEPGFAKLALGFKLEQIPCGNRVITETRVDTTDPLSHRRFGAYWRVIHVWSAAIRRSWLRALKRRAQRAPTPAEVALPPPSR